MNIHDALKAIDWKKAEYFKYLHPELRYDLSKPLKSEEDFLRLVNRKSMNSFTKWEKTAEYKNLVMIYLNTKIADDFEEVYRVISDKSKQGDEKAIRIFLTLQKDIQQNAKLAVKALQVEDEELEEDDLDLDLS